MGTRFGTVAAAIACIFAWAFFVAERGREGALRTRFLQKQVAPFLLRVSGVTTDLKFRLRGPRPVRNKIVIVEVDDNSLHTFGRWPWPRIQDAFLIEQIMKYEPRTVGLDMFFSEEEDRIPDTL